MSCKGWGCFVSSPDADRMRRLESRNYSCKPELQARDFSREKLTDDPTEEYFFKVLETKEKAKAAMRKEIEEAIEDDESCEENDYKGRTLDECVEALEFFDGSYEVYVEELDLE